MKYLIFGDEGLIGTEIKKQIKGEYACVDVNTQEIPEGDFDCIIHLAANCIIREVIKDPELARSNVSITHEIFEIAREKGIKKIVYFSSSRVRGDLSNPYVASKLYGECLCKAYKDCYDIDCLIIRPETVWSMEDKHRRVITAWIEAARDFDDIFVFGNKEKELSPIHVESFVKKFLQILQGFIDGSDSQRIYGISGEPINVVELTNKIKKHFNSKSKIIFKDSEKTQPQEKILQDIIIVDFDKYLKVIK